MTKILSHLVAGPLPAVVFFLTFILIGDVLIAGAAAIAVATVELAIIWSAHSRPSAVIWISVALVIFLCAMTLAGQDASATTALPISSSCDLSHCVCLPVFRDL